MKSFKIMERNMNLRQLAAGEQIGWLLITERNMNLRQLEAGEQIGW